MKKIVIAAIGLVTIVAAVGLVSAGFGPGATERPQENFVDEDDDGVCDNMIDEDNDGVCDSWVDEDGDGMNDNRPMGGTGNQYRHGSGKNLRSQAESGFRAGNGNCPYE